VVKPKLTRCREPEPPGQATVTERTGALMADQGLVVPAMA
jgi:hypothetical protein